MAEHETEPSAKRRRLPQPTPKHTIFLSHSGNEKDFVEQLHEDLKRMNHNPFFDQDRDSLPKGDKFPSKILSAAEQCLLAVVVLSEGYLGSKWPMLELSTFVKSMKGRNPKLKLFPVFYKLSPSDISAERVDTKWRESWMKLVQEGKVSGEEIALWGDAVRELRAFNGVEFSKYGPSEVKYRKAVVEDICNKVPPLSKYKTDDIRGYGRLCEITSKMFEEGTSEEIICREGCNYLGLYGLGGVGKSTLCRAMCSYFQEEYGSRVCHVELPSDAEEWSAGKGRVSRVKSILRGLSGLDTRIVDSIDSESEGLECLENRLRGQPPVFLAVDNVGDSDSSRNEAQGLVRAILATGSKVMVTSRSRAILKSIFCEEKYCKPISRLEKPEARELFLSVAAPKKSICRLQPFEDEIVEVCLGECQFKEDGYSTPQYHPLVLRALGCYFYDVDEDNLLNWKQHLLVTNKLQESRESKRVSGILGLNYFALPNIEKLVFLDVALLMNARFASFDEDNFNDDDGIVGFYINVMDYKWRVAFIATLHGISPLSAERKVKELQRKALIYEASPTLDLHDLYKEFAQSLVMKEGSREREWWVHSKNWAIGMNFGLMKRMCLDGGKAKIFHNPHQLPQCEKLECLMLVKCHAPTNFTLDLGCLKSLRVLILEYVEGLVEIVCSLRGDDDGECLSELGFVKLCGQNLKRIPFLTQCYSLTSLLIDVYDEELVDFIHYDESRIFEKLKVLNVLSLYYGIDPTEMPLEEILNCASSLQSLRYMQVNLGYSDYEDNFGAIRHVDLSPLGGLSMLSTVYLSLYKTLEVQGLNQLCGLTTLKLSNVGDSMFESVDQLSQLNTLDLSFSKHLCLLPNLDILPNLREVCIYKCCSLENFISLSRKYEEIKDHNHHQCHQPYCKSCFCNICIDRHRRFGVPCQSFEMHCNICIHLKIFPGGGCTLKHCSVCTRLS